MRYRFAIRALLIPAALVLTGSAVAQQGGCKCSDLRDLYVRHCSAKHAIDEWSRLINQTKMREAKSGEIMSALDHKESVAKCVDEVIAITRKESPASHTAKGETDRNCNVTVNAPTECLRGVIAHHESWHKMACEAHNRPDAPWRTTENPFKYLAAVINRMSAQSLVDYMLEERTGYMLEKDYTRDRLEELAERCESPFVFERSSGNRRSYTIKPCPQPDYTNYDRKCSF